MSAPWISLAALIGGSVCAALHLALRDLASVKLHEISVNNARPAASRRIARILDDLEGHSSAVAVPRVLCHVVALVAMVEWINALVDENAHTLIGPALGVAAATPLLWLLGAAIPQSVASHAGERVVYRFSPILRATYLVMAPARAVVAFFDEMIRRLAGASEPGAADEIEAELLSVVEEGEREGQFDETERDMIGSVVKLRNTSVDAIMTPRTEIEAFELTDDPSQIKQLVLEKGHSRIPVYEKDVDHIVGFLYARDVLHWMASERDNGAFDIESILRPAMFVPETKNVRDLLKELVDQKIHITMVTDEYGGTSGLVTIEDIVEEIFGEIQDEYDSNEQEPDVNVDVQTRSAQVDARVNIDDANDELKAIGAELPESEEYDTVGGFVLAALGRIPVAGEQVRHGRITLTVLEAEATRVSRVRVGLDELVSDSVNGA